ncbi:transporter substrate-binding domain-containing protein [Candidatus Amarolinea dominans]|uniref:transporter substrate-binding domain-containing protein n=1 Tax=Candidatus Amarolinea dominans TaxID=3140696 RepID=UPI0031CC787F
MTAYNNLPDLKGRKIKAVTANDFPPLNFIDGKTGKAMGWEYDAIAEICRRLNCTVDWQVTSWDTMIAAVKAGQFDVGMDGITITEERKQQVDFSDPYLRSEQFMLVRGRDPFQHAGAVQGRSQAVDRLAGRHHQLLRRGLQRARRRREEPAHHPLRDLRRDRAGPSSRATWTWC